MKFNLEVKIKEVVEQHTHGVLKYGEVQLCCYRSTGEVQILQDENAVWLVSEQAKQLYMHLKSVFGE